MMLFILNHILKSVSINISLTYMNPNVESMKPQFPVILKEIQFNPANAAMYKTIKQPPSTTLIFDSLVKARTAGTIKING